MCIQPRCTLGKKQSLFFSLLLFSYLSLFFYIARSGTDFRNRILGIWKNDSYDTPTFDWRIGKGIQIPKELDHMQTTQRKKVK